MVQHPTACQNRKRKWPNSIQDHSDVRTVCTTLGCVQNTHFLLVRVSVTYIPLS